MKANWDDLKIFLTVARAGTLGAAARALGQSQPTMGRRVRALEDQLGYALFQRTDDGFLLTGEGEAVLEHVRQMEHEADAVVRKLAGRQRLEGLLRVSTIEWFGTHMLAPVFARFSADNPGMTIELVTETRLVSLARREADLVFRFRQFDDPDVIQRKAMHARFGVYGAGAYLKQAGPPGDGAGHRLIIMETAYSELVDVAWITRRLPRAHVALRANSRDVQANLCRGGAGLAVLPRCIGDGLRGLRLVDLGEPPPGRDVWAGYHKDLKRSPRLRAVLDAALDGLREADA
ncbi:DNA-binding transcriptional LysR family regulator [Duganella sp. 1411]|uniref:LysR family transcriptional regulator n=1 Tax=Duganella sp. 1411 TaxID=2806572 RepID=UPI001AE589E2|nr:LysR family transcriptional regulator [Duganella sp. 1411]MBP1207858.1 DNA-binding transcriptional LysR family regulator [Duganella sp. 1411]